MTGVAQPLDRNFQIVDPQTGLPTVYFIQWAQKRQIDITASITAADALKIVKQFLTDHSLIAGSGIALTPSGDIGAGVTITAQASAILDQLSNVRGTVLFRGAANWQGLAPGVAGQFLQTAGAGANPVWAAAGGGGGGSGIEDQLNAQLASYVALNPTGNLPQGTNLDIIKDGGGHVGLLFYANTLSGVPISGSTYTVPTGYIAVCPGGNADIQVQQNPSFYKHRLYNVTQAATVAGFEGGAYNRADGWRIQYSGIMTSSSGGNPNNVSYPIVGVAGDVLRCEANSAGDGNYRLQAARYYLTIVNATTGALRP